MPRPPASPEVRKAQVKDQAFAMRPLSAVMRVLTINQRGSMKIKTEGTIRLPTDPCAQGSIAYIMFFKMGSPAAVALFNKVERNMGDWIVHYSNVEWLNPNPTKES